LRNVNKRFARVRLNSRPSFRRSVNGGIRRVINDAVTDLSRSRKRRSIHERPSRSKKIQISSPVDGFYEQWSWKLLLHPASKSATLRYSVHRARVRDIMTKSWSKKRISFQGKASCVVAVAANVEGESTRKATVGLAAIADLDRTMCRARLAD